jgi:hypothetical protein
VEASYVEAKMMIQYILIDTKKAVKRRCGRTDDIRKGGKTHL